MDLIKIREKLNAGESIYRLPLRVAYYARVSTEKEEQQNSLANQKAYYEKLIRENPDWIFSGAYIDEGLSGTSVEKRIHFLAMIEDAKKHRFDLIITKEISRFSRNTLDSLQYTRLLLDQGVGVFFQSDNINTLLPDAELRLAIMSSIAQDEVRKLSERVKFGFKRAQESGVILGNDNLFGYRKKDGKLCIVPEEAAIIRKIFDLYVQKGLGLRKIAQTLTDETIVSRSGKPFSYATLYGMIRNPKYKGYYAGNKFTTLDYRSKKKIRREKEEWILRRDPEIEAIVAEETWDAANALLEKRGKKFKEKEACFQNRYSYSGKILCGEHECAYHRIVVTGRNGAKEAWFCREYRLKGKVNGCDGPFFYTEELDEIMQRVWEQFSCDREKICLLLKEAYQKSGNKSRGKPKIIALEKEIQTYRVRKEKILDLSVEGFLSNEEFRIRNEALNQKLKVLFEEKEKLENSIQSQKEEKISEYELLNWIRDFTWDPELVTELNRDLLEKIVVSGSREEPRLEIYLHGQTHREVSYRKKDRCILLWDMGISQAQVSRLEKGALNRIRKQM